MNLYGIRNIHWQSRLFMCLKKPCTLNSVIAFDYHSEYAIHHILASIDCLSIFIFTHW